MAHAFFKVEQTKVYGYVSHSAPQNHELQKLKDLRSGKQAKAEDSRLK
jgi:hypothetical protein